MGANRTTSNASLSRHRAQPARRRHAGNGASARGWEASLSRRPCAWSLQLSRVRVALASEATPGAQRRPRRRSGSARLRSPSPRPTSRSSMPARATTSSRHLRRAATCLRRRNARRRRSRLFNRLPPAFAQCSRVLTEVVSLVMSNEGKAAVVDSRTMKTKRLFSAHGRRRLGRQRRCSVPRSEDARAWVSGHRLGTLQRRQAPAGERVLALK